jgi:hypothetical protein
MDQSYHLSLVTGPRWFVFTAGADLVVFAGEGVIAEMLGFAGHTSATLASILVFMMGSL